MRRLSFIALVWLGLSLPAAVPAADALILVSGGFPGADQIAAGFTQGFKGQVAKAAVGENAADVSAVLAREQPRLLLVLGRSAGDAVRGQAKLPMIFCDDGAGRFNLAGRQVVRIERQVSVEDQFRAFTQLAPAPKSIGVVYQDRGFDAAIEKMKGLLENSGRELRVFRVAGIKEVPNAMRSALEQSEGLWLLPDAKVVNEVSRQYVLMLAFNYRKPILTQDPAVVSAGAALGLVPDEEDIARQALVWAERLLQGKDAPAEAIVPASRRVVNAKVLQYFNLAVNP